MDLSRRVKIIEARERRLARLIARTFSLVISFESNNNHYYDIKTKKLDGRILIEIDMSTMAAKGYFSGEAGNIVTLMNREWAYKEVHRWEVAAK
jgi:hypothetical protein